MLIKSKKGSETEWGAIITPVMVLGVIIVVALLLYNYNPHSGKFFEESKKELKDTTDQLVKPFETVFGVKKVTEEKKLDAEKAFDEIVLGVKSIVENPDKPKSIELKELSKLGVSNIIISSVNGNNPGVYVGLNDESSKIIKKIFIQSNTAISTGYFGLSSNNLKFHEQEYMWLVYGKKYEGAWFSLWGYAPFIWKAENELLLVLSEKSLLGRITPLPYIYYSSKGQLGFSSYDLSRKLTTESSSGGIGLDVKVGERYRFSPPLQD